MARQNFCHQRGTWGVRQRYAALLIKTKGVGSWMYYSQTLWRLKQLWCA